jgi:hypothetical protein
MKKWILALVGLMIVLGISIHPAVSVTCDIESIKEYVIEQGGINRDSLEILDSGEREIYNVKFFFAEILNGKRIKDYYVRCDTEEVFDHKPSFREIFKTKISGALWEKMQESDANEFDIVVYKNVSSLTNTEALNKLTTIGMEIINVREYGEGNLFEGNASREEIDKISNIGWVEEIDVKIYPVSMFIEDDTQLPLLYKTIWILIPIILALVILTIYLFKRKRRLIVQTEYRRLGEGR